MSTQPRIRAASPTPHKCICASVLALCFNLFVEKIQRTLRQRPGRMDRPGKPLSKIGGGTFIISHTLNAPPRCIRGGRGGPLHSIGPTGPSLQPQPYFTGRRSVRPVSSTEHPRGSWPCPLTASLCGQQTVLTLLRVFPHEHPPFGKLSRGP